MFPTSNQILYRLEFNHPHNCLFVAFVFSKTEEKLCDRNFDGYLIVDNEIFVSASFDRDWETWG